jgi:hypothetical protein
MDMTTATFKKVLVIRLKSRQLLFLSGLQFVVPPAIMVLISTPHSSTTSSHTTRQSKV